MSPRKLSSRAGAWLALLAICLLVALVVFFVERRGQSASAERVAASASAESQAGIAYHASDDDEREDEADSHALEKKLDALERELAGGDASPHPP